MPEYAQIQTYATCNRATFPTVLHRYRKVLEQFHCSDAQIPEWLTNITWPIDDDDSFGDVYPSPFTLTTKPGLELPCDGLEVSLYMHSAVPSLDDPPTWVGFNLLLDVEQIREPHSTIYTAKLSRAIWPIMQALSTQFSELGVYLTDEWQENQAWRTIAENAGDPWVFDIAIFPRNLAEHFAHVPAGFKGTVVDNKFSFAQENRWQQLPWEGI